MGKLDRRKDSAACAVSYRQLPRLSRAKTGRSGTGGCRTTLQNREHPGSLLDLCSEIILARRPYPNLRATPMADRHRDFRRDLPHQCELPVFSVEAEVSLPPDGLALVLGESCPFDRSCSNRWARIGGQIYVHSADRAVHYDCLGGCGCVACQHIVATPNKDYR